MNFFLKRVKGPLKENFKKMDINEDGFITIKELKGAPKAERKERLRNKKKYKKV